jgi:cell division protease FtsH
MAGEKLTGTKKSRQYKALEEMEEQKKRENTPPPDPGKQPPVAPATDANAAPVAEIKPAPAAGTTPANDGDAQSTTTIESHQENS